MLDLSDRHSALAIARRAAERTVGSPSVRDPADLFRDEPLAPVFDEPHGVFVTWKRYPGLDLRGCVGFPLPVLPLRAGLPRASVAAALEDPRFPPMTARELLRTVLEVSVLTVPVPLRAARSDDLLRSVEVGRHGLVVDGFGASGLLLPQVAPEQGWSAEEFLNGTCEKAGLPPHAWRDPRVTVRRFEAEVFGEAAPGTPAEPLVATPATAAASRAPRS